MDDNRLQLLKQYMEEDPNDPFNIYAVATEYKNINLEKALHYYEELLTKHPAYLPTYYQVAQVYTYFGKSERIEDTYKKGISLAKDQNELNTLRELQNAYNEFLFDD